jgi:tagatose 1,6-diphosphate aldolase
MLGTLTPAKIRHLQALSDQRGVIAAAAIDQRGSLQKAIGASRGLEATDDMLREFKTAVSKILTPYASAILLDPQWGLEAAGARAENAGLLLAYEESGYDNTRPGRRPDLLPHLSARRIKDLGANAVKVLIYYSPFEDPDINDEKHAFIERIGAECEACDIPFFLEFVGYDPQGGNEKGLEYAKIKPESVRRSTEEFSKEKYHVDVLKVEVPINMAYAQGSSACGGEYAYTKKQALEELRQAAEAARKPFIYLSAGVSNQLFTETLRWVAESGVHFSGVLCGRATWLEGIPVYAKGGVQALEAWLRTAGVANIQAVNECLREAQPWYEFYGVNNPSDLAARRAGVA